MSGRVFVPTEEQRRIIQHDTSAIVQACPGAGKTAVLVERIRKLVVGNPERGGGRGIAMISFSKAAINELRVRLTSDAILPSPPFPHFIGTFDSFIWKFLVAPFGIPGVNAAPRLLPDKDTLEIGRFPNDKRTLDLSCFDHHGEIIPDKARRRIGETAPLLDRDIDRYQHQARATMSRLWKEGWLDYRDARSIAAERLQTDTTLSRRLAVAVSARFREVLVDEAQDCNPEDLLIIQWLSNVGIVIKVVCDPHQSIYFFRGGIDPADLAPLRAGFDVRERHQLTGNFRSGQNICQAVSALRCAETRTVPPIQAVGDALHSRSQVFVLAYPGAKVDSSIGEGFQRLIQKHGFKPDQCPVLAKTKASAAAAVGRRDMEGTRTAARSLRLAKAVMKFHFPTDARDRSEALTLVHEVTLELGGILANEAPPTKTMDKRDSERLAAEEKVSGISETMGMRSRRRTYNQYLEEEQIRPESWQPWAISLLRELDPRHTSDTGCAWAWHERAKTLLALTSRQLPWSKDLVAALTIPSVDTVLARTIHSVKGCEFPAVCVVMTNAKRILDTLITDEQDNTEEVREIYVAASRARHLLAFAVPVSQANRLVRYLETATVQVQWVDLSQAEQPRPASRKSKHERQPEDHHGQQCLPLERT